MAKKIKKGLNLEVSEASNEEKTERAKARRQALHKAKISTLDVKDAREAFRKYWLVNKKAYGREKDIEEILWIHLKSVSCIQPDQFEDGITEFGLKKLGEK